MRLFSLIVSLPALAGALAAAPASIQQEIRENDAPNLGEITPVEARTLARLANPARHMVDRPRWESRVENPPPRDTGPIPVPLITTFSPRDHRYRHQVTRITLHGGPESRFLRMVLIVNCGEDARLTALLDDTEGEMLNEVLENLFGALSFEQVRHPSQKGDLREQMIIAFNQILHTNSIKDVYYDTFVVY